MIKFWFRFNLWVRVMVRVRFFLVDDEGGTNQGKGQGYN